MTTLNRWDPFRELTTLQDRVNRLFHDAWGPISGVPATRGGEESLLGGSFAPPVDVYEDEQQIVLKMEVPGIDQKDIDIQIENNVLTIRGERKLEKEEKEENFQRIERRYGSFTRAFTLPTSVDPEKVSAEYVNGLLKISLAKREEAKPKQIKVAIGGKQIEAGKGRAA
jgi:HSP20 family protein